MRSMRILEAPIWIVDQYMQALTKAMYLMGPVCVVLASCLISAVAYVYFQFALPLAVGPSHIYGLAWWSHTCLGLFLLFNIVFNWIQCVRTNPGSPKSEHYKRLLKEARAEYVTVHNDDRTGPRHKRRGSRDESPGDEFQNAAALNKSKHWCDLGENEWSICKHSGTLKPPRAHYDSVTGMLVMNMDHYCPWMANAVGYGNYRYFYLFLLYMCVGAGYAATIATPVLFPELGFSGPMDRRGSIILLRGSRQQAQQDQQQQQHQRRLDELDASRFVSSSVVQEKMALRRLQRESEPYLLPFFVLTVSVSLAVMTLLLFHTYLVLTAQTTIEVHGNRARKSRFKKVGIVWQNPYDLGWRRNWQQVFGKGNCVLALLPSCRPPPWPPWPQHRHSSSPMAMGALSTAALRI